MQPVGAIFFADAETRAHPAADDVLIHRGEFAILDAGLDLVIRRRAREAGGEIGFARMDELHRTAGFLDAPGRRQNVVVILLAAEAAAHQILVHEHLQLFGFLLQYRRQITGQRHARERGALRADVNMPFAVGELHRGIERLHGGVADHVGGVFHLQHLVGFIEPGIDIAFQHPGRACFFVPGQFFVFIQQRG